MSTTGVTSWAGDLAEIGAVYPFQGFEVPLAIVGVVAWLAWHVWCIRWEQQYHRERIAKYGNSEVLARAIANS